MARVKIDIDEKVVDAVLSEKDEFRLAIGGVTLIEALLEGAISVPSSMVCPRPSRGSNGPALSAWRGRSN